MRSKLAEILGVEEDQVFIADGCRYRIHNGHRQWHDGETWKDVHNEDVLTDIINGKTNIRILTTFTEKEVDVAKALRVLFPNAEYVYAGDREKEARVACYWSNVLKHDILISGNAFPSMKAGEVFRLDEIIGSVEDA